jgi:hypothetical protein
MEQGHCGSIRFASGRTLTAQLLEARVDRRKIVGSSARGTVNLSSWVSRMGCRRQAMGIGFIANHCNRFRPRSRILGPGSSMLGGSDVIAAEVEKVIDLIVG